jgi:hypothetical protein
LHWWIVASLQTDWRTRHYLPRSQLQQFFIF